MVAMSEYGEIDVTRLGANYVRLEQSGDGRTDEIYVPLSEVDDLVNALRIAEPGSSNTEGQ